MLFVAFRTTGLPQYGQLGHATDNELHFDRFLSLSGGNAASCHCVALDTEGPCYTWGRNEASQLGHGDKITRDRPTVVSELSKKVSLVMEIKLHVIDQLLFLNYPNPPGNDTLLHLDAYAKRQPCEAKHTAWFSPGLGIENRRMSLLLDELRFLQAECLASICSCFSRFCQFSMYCWSAKPERARRRKGQTLRPNGNEQRRNEKMRCLGHPHLERRVEGFGPVAFPVPPSSGGACVEGAPPEIGLESLTLPTSQELMAVGHDYYQKAPMKIIFHMEECASLCWVFFCCATRWLMCNLWPTPPIQGGQREL
ncbi:Cytochrome c biogenesis CcmF C-terminal-like mitochondrial protein [Capsicum baccatum]|uniref:Cytochrome c biogenesis CcmF C-terminal-like mitochondrial protein n=1 Tax=Capsicum baccatum TaxID=33114 RepID=A0A2G2WU53_CAPBA|nr:Cytochrome c biogenesis CcmF C-terminal-like mitochondrial protein [Capsicum baccatum]